jgi:hypothetical protein
LGGKEYASAGCKHRIVACVENPAHKAMFSKINWRLIPLLLIAYMVAYLHRIYSMYFVMALYLLSGTLLLLAIRPASIEGVPAAEPAH